MDQGIGFSVEKPISVWNKELDVDFKAFFKGLTKYAIHGLNGQWASAGEDLVDITSAVGLQTKPAELAWLLIRRSLAKAMAKLTVETLRVHGKEPADPDALIEALDLALEQTSISIEPWFFERPADLPITQAVKPPFAQWLEGFELNAQQASGSNLTLGTLVWRQR